MKATIVLVATAAYLASSAVAIGIEEHIQARAPAPTPAPNAQHLNRALHRARAITADLDQTCGFANGDAFRPVSCRAGHDCVLNSFYDVGGCCATSLPVSDCILATSCVDYSVATALADIGDYTVACDDPSFPSCLGYLYETFTFFGCGTTRTIIPLEVVATYSGTINGGAAATSSVPVIADVTATPSAASQSGVVAPFASVASQGSASSPTTTSFVQSQPAGKTGLSTGAIVGIAVACAVVAIAGIVAIGVVMWRRNKSKRQAEEQRLSQAQMMMGGQPGPDPSNPGGPGSPSVAGSGMPHSPAQPNSPFTPPPMSQQWGPPSASGHGSSQFEGSGKTGMVTVMPNGMDQRFSGQQGSQYFGSDTSGADGRMSPPVAQIPPQHQFAGREDMMSNDGTASVMPQHPHNPPHIS